MRRSLVAVLYVHSLFGEGIGQLLRSDKELQVTCLPAEDESARTQLKHLRPRAIVIESPHDGAIWQVVRDLPPAMIIRVSLDEQVMDVYDGHRIVRAGPETLVDAIHTALPHRPA